MSTALVDLLIRVFYNLRQQYILCGKERFFMCAPGQIQQEERERLEIMAPAEQMEAPLVNEHLHAAPQQINLYGTTQLDNAETLFDKVQRLSRSPVADHEPAQNDNLSYKERKNREKVLARQKEQYKQFGKTNRLLRLQEVASLPLLRSRDGRKSWMQDKVPHSQLTREETMRRILDENDYSNFENLDAIMRNVVASSALAKFIRQYNVTPQSDPKVLCEQIERDTEGVSGLLNPGLRLGLSLAQRTKEIPDEMKDLFRRLDEAMSTAVMVKTLTHYPNERTVETYFQEKGAAAPQEKAKEAIAANQSQQIQIAKRLLLMQLSEFKVITKGDPIKFWDKSMAVAFSHCSRVTMTLPAQEKKTGSGNTAEDHARMWRSILTTNGENSAKDNRRGGSTHSVKRRKVRGPDYESKEKKVLVNMIGQRGMNCAIGGLGNAGIGGKTLCNDGSCGHFYSMHKEADVGHYGTMLMGLESDAHAVTNQMGHTHDMHATPEKASSLGGQRVDEIGNKYGGRQCDLSQFTASDITAWMLGLETFMREAHRAFDVVNPTDDSHYYYDRDYKIIMEYLSGQKMNYKQWSTLRRIIKVPNAAGGNGLLF